MKYDVIVIGAVPAGTAAAITCQKNGLKVCVITKPRESISNNVTPSQSIHPGVLVVLEQLGLKHIVEVASESTFTSINVDGNINRLSSQEEEWYGHHINRVVFDDLLLAELSELGISVIQRKVQSTDIVFNTSKTTLSFKDGLQINAIFCIDASGYNRVSNRNLKLKEKTFSVPMHCWSAVSRNTLNQEQETQFQVEDQGWLWLAPNADKNEMTWTKLIINKRVDKAFPFGPDYLSKVYVHNVRWRAFRPICKHQVLLCGDAGGILDPAAGQGILNALMSGVMAAHCVINSKQNPDLKNYHFAYYDQWFITQFEEKVSHLRDHYTSLGLSVTQQY